VDAEKWDAWVKKMVCLKFCPFGTPVYMNTISSTLSSNPRLEVSLMSFVLKSCSMHKQHAVNVSLLSPMFTFAHTDMQYCM